MHRVKVRRAAQITLPEEARRKLGVTEGDYLEAEVVENGVLLKPAPQEREPGIEAAIAEGLADVRAGRVTPAFESMEEFEAYQRTNRYKKLIRDDL